MILLDTLRPSPDTRWFLSVVLEGADEEGDGKEDESKEGDDEEGDGEEDESKRKVKTKMMK